MYYFGERYYDARLSRWISADKALMKYLPSAGKSENKLPGEGGVFRPVNIDVYHYGGNNPIKYLDLDGNEDIVFVKAWMTYYKKFESYAMIYPNGTLTPDKVSKLQLANSVLGPFFTPNVVRYILGEPIKEFDNFSSLPNIPTKHGTAKAGVLYDYKRNDFYTEKGQLISAFLLSDPSLKDKKNNKVPQDLYYNNGINPSSNKNYVEGSHIHGAARGLYDSTSEWYPDGNSYDNGSRGCITGYGSSFNIFFNYLKSSSTGQSGKTIIFRYGWDYNF